MYSDDSLVLHTDAYQINMIYTYWKQGIDQKPVVFEAYFRKMPFNNGYVIFSGLERIVKILNQLKFTDDDIDYLQSLDLYDTEFLTYLKNWHLTATIRSAYEGEVMFNNEPLLQVEGPLVDAQLLETLLLNIINFQTLIATKAARIASVTNGDPLLEFGTRRAQELDAALWGTRAAFIGGFDATSNVRAGKLFNIPISGTHAHALVQAYHNDYDAFHAYAATHKNVVFLVDTFDTLKSGVPNAIKVAREFGDKINFQGVRIDSGDMAYLSKKVRIMLDEAGFTNAKIYASNDLDENTILNLKIQGAKIDVWGIGTKLITAYDQPALGAVYKMVSIDGDDTIKLSNNVEKISTPGKKQVWRITDSKDGKSEGDYLTFDDENPSQLETLHMFDPNHPVISKNIKNFDAQPMLHDIFVEGDLIYDLPDITTIKSYAKHSLNDLWDEYKRILNPETYPVDLSQKLYDAKMNLIHDIRNNIQEMTK
ncbi:MAG: nicotinate phosphoribosyltransferase [Leuconostoc mesenteroides]|jgi:nicotinate phosphoribosyltransferase|uniref:Nicotinate phosphoribosyltransferase n=3 Tax=Leuconostoc TaxID=1243 RepID=A0A222YG26_LEUME|nr:MULTISPECIES: nicotinate phosphoribosyltransferase [Leuconostoc]MBC9701678.1 nicotinate phosphoribosyltransferase [Leuconostoc sp.]ABJ62632.1 Nicotinic acid phosphoribosyltransferase [Leuconostoc mesenteroides subsp. mesenteroides ATCC 8293]AET30821.2 nicotinate phosphoribosyltransferase [Leuconostoc mesenteroides subsp. mesenteroides J18]APE77094.1 nicotinate phosphoribosyltransferase [Leuconostoc mesenteroides subsp. jonggajibkimchii]AQU49783.1 nicotinate phosphoribosyltransferase [Leucon